MLARRTLSISALILLPGALAAQAYAELDVNNVRARFFSDGMIGMDPFWGTLNYEAPIGSDAHPLFVANLWMGGTTAGSQVKLAAVRYNQIGEDWYPGPLSVDGSSSISQTTSDQYDEVWNVHASEIALHMAYCECLADPNCDETLQYPGYQAPAYFNDWPAHGDVGLNQDYNLAPFIDFDGDNAYDPAACDAPCGRGDQSLYFIFNDHLSAHTESFCGPIGVEVQATPFAYAGPTAALANTVFVQYRIINRSTETLIDFHVGLFTDFDLGCASDDFIGCDVERSLWYGYNGDNDDEDCNGHQGYGPQPPAFGVTILNGLFADYDGLDHAQDSAVVAFNGSGSGDAIIDNERHGLSHFIRFHNNGAAMGDPENCGEYYNLLRGIWRNGSPLTYGDAGFGGLVPARFGYPDASDPLGLGTGGNPQPPWSEITAASVPFDRRGIGSMGPITLEPGMVNTVLVAFVYARAGSGGPWASVQALQARVDSVRAFADSQDWYSGGREEIPCDQIQVGIAEEHSAVQASLTLSPVPANEAAVLLADADLAGQLLLIHDATGRTVWSYRLLQGTNELDVSQLARGIYTCEVRSPRARYTGRLVKE